MNCPVQALEKIWPGLKIVHGRPRHPQSQGSVERANAEVSKLVRLCKEEAGGSWVKALPRAQLKLNMNYHSGIKCSPIEALYGKTASIGLASTSLPPSCYQRDGKITEDDFEAMLAGEYQDPVDDFDPSLQLDTPEAAPSTAPTPAAASSDTPAPLQQSCSPETSAVPNLYEESPSSLEDEEGVHITLHDTDLLELIVCGVCNKPLDQDVSCAKCLLSIHPECGSSGICSLCVIGEQRSKKRKLVIEAQEKQALKMLKRSEINQPVLRVGDNVRVPVPKVDRGRLDSHSLIGVVTEITEHGSYKVGTEQGQVKGALARNMVDKCKQKVFLAPENVPDTLLSVRQAATKASSGHGQGFFSCNCRQGCQSGRCKCKKSNKLCNSRCHINLACQNKG